MTEKPRTGAFYGSVAKLVVRLALVLVFFASALLLWTQLVPWLAHSNRFLAGLVAIFAGIPAYMGAVQWAGPGKLAARHLRLLGGKPILTLNATGFRYLSFTSIAWSEVQQIRYIARVDTNRSIGPLLVLQTGNSLETVLAGDPSDVWAYGRFSKQVLRWVDVDAQQWLFLDLALLAGASSERVGYWMAGLREHARSAHADISQLEHH